MRVVAGEARRIQLRTLEGIETRPTTDRIKETLFNMIAGDLYDCRFLDLFSGSGGIGIEALSRGAKSAVFIESNRQAADCIKENLEKTCLYEKGKILLGDVLVEIEVLQRQQSEPFSIIFMDPPYGKELERRVLEKLVASTLINRESLVIVEAAKETAFSYVTNYGYEIIKEKKYKTNQHIFLRFIG